MMFRLTMVPSIFQKPALAWRLLMRPDEKALRSDGHDGIGIARIGQFGDQADRIAAPELIFTDLRT